MKNWKVPELDRQTAKRLAQEYDLPVVTAMLLTLRGITSPEDIERFFSQQTELADPLEITDMDKAVKKIKNTVVSGKRICVFGDYDCDGVTSTAILYLYLQSVFADVVYYIPDRNKEGYGLNKKAVEKLNADNVRLIITVDNGITAIDEVDFANSLGIDVVITDHHKPLDLLPRAAAVVDPHRTDENSSFHDYSGAGLVLKLISALENDSQYVLENYSDLAALGTVADIVPLRGENREIVRNGLVQLNNTERVGLLSLYDAAGIEEVTADSIAYRIGPRINAAGRLTTPYDALSLLLTESEDQASEQAEKLDKLNERRQSIESGIADDIIGRLSEDPKLSMERIIIASSEGWNAGVIGIVSSRITERFGKPSIIISEDGEVCKASGRSVQGFSLVDAVFACSEYLEKFGGHPMAVGFSIKKENIPLFRKAMCEYAAKNDRMPLPSVRIECFLNPEIIVPDIIHEIKAFEPFGAGNPKPLFGIKNLLLDRITPVGGGHHLRLSFSRGRMHFSMMKFFTEPEDFIYQQGDALDVAVNLELNNYRGNDSITFSIKELRPAGFDTESALYEIQDYELFRNGGFRSRMGDKCPERPDFVQVYNYLRQHKERTSIDRLCTVLRNMTPFRLLIILDTFREVLLLRYTRNGDLLDIELIDPEFKVSLDRSPTYKRLKEEIRNAGKN